jgi:hypothetical protein
MHFQQTDYQDHTGPGYPYTRSPGPLLVLGSWSSQMPRTDHPMQLCVA